MNILIYIFCIVAGIIFLIDFAYFLFYRYCRFHIGRWKNTAQWVTAVKNKAIKWTKHTPTVKISDNSRYLMIDMILKKYRSISIQSWQAAAINLGLLRHGILNSDNLLKHHLNSNGTWKKNPVAVDSSFLAYSLLLYTNNHMEIKPAMDFMIDIVLKNTDSDGLISYCGGIENEDRYVDTIGLVCPFLALYAKKYNKPEFEELAYRQIEFYQKYGLYNNLPNHAINKKTKLPLGVYGWGRGAIWYVIGLVETYYHTKNPHKKATIKSWIKDCAITFTNFQHNDGGFGCILQREKSYDSSATAGMSFFYRACSEILNDERYNYYADKCLNALKKRTRIDGSIDFCQGDTKDIGIFSTTFDIMPFAQGLALCAITDNMDLDRFYNE